MEPKQLAPYPLRMPAEMRDELEKIAKANGRSMNAEIVMRLQQTFDSNSTAGNLITLPMDDLDALIESAISRAIERSSLSAPKKSAK